MILLSAMGIKVLTRGDFKRTKAFLERGKALNYKKTLERYGEAGVKALSSATPIDTGKTASSWRYDIVIDDTSARVIWSNDNVVNGWCNVAIMLQYGHATRGGEYVQGIDYINPALRQIFEDMADAAWKEVTGL